jgi:hypothetical protein
MVTPDFVERFVARERRTTVLYEIAEQLKFTSRQVEWRSASGDLGFAEVGADVFATPQQVARGFLLLRGNVDRRQGPGPIQDSQLAGGASIGLDPIAGTAWNEGRRDHLTRDLPCR